MVNLKQQTAFHVAFEQGHTHVCEAFNKDKEESETFLNEQDEQTSYELNEVKVFGQVIVHLDLKGAPPRFEFLENLLRFIAKHFKRVVTGVLIEFEDMFPYTGFLS